jgi:thiol-disulfide isomerase/thioredoxin
MNINMKYIVAVLFIAITVASCTPKEKHFATVTGQFKGKAEGKEIHLCKVEHGKTTKVATSQIGENGRFGFKQAVADPGLYVVNVVKSKTQIKDIRDYDLTRLYLENGAMVNVEIEKGSYKLLQTNCEKNKTLEEWSNVVDTLYAISHGRNNNFMTYKDYFPMLPEYKSKMKEFQNGLNSGDASFDELMRLMAETDLASSALRMLQSMRTIHPKKEEYPAYYKEMVEKQQPNSIRLLDLPNGREYLRAFTLHAVVNYSNAAKESNYFELSLNHIGNDLLKGYYSLDNSRKYRTYDDKYLSFKSMVEPYLTNEYLREGFKTFEMSIRKFEKGALAYNFSGKDVNGKEHQLADYKGKLVYVDVWATWCGPCKAQIPALKKLEKKLHGKSITFLSISLDKQKDLQKWKDFIKEKNLGGVQLIADDAFNSDVAKAYGIKGIPRFMLFDKEGKVITIDAPRPSKAGTEEWLRSLL